MKQWHLLLILLLVGVFGACSGRQKQPTPSAQRPLHDFVLPQPPVTMTQPQQAEYLRDHYWDHFRFSDTTALATVDTMAMLRHFGLYASICALQPTNGEPMRRLMQRAASSRAMCDLFLYLADMVLHDPNSPLRNDEFYIPILETQLATAWYDTYERIAPTYDLEMARKNRIGHPANDFRYTTADGRSHTLYTLQAEYLLLFFNNPDCAMCKEIREAIDASELLSALIAEGRLKVLALYPDEDLQAWHNYRKQIPASWINAYDAEGQIRNEERYSLNAIPSLYLLDHQKRVIFKDSTDVGALEAFLGQ